jgi:ATP-dependent Clp protease ATP-binding subunit ClpB
MNYNIAAREGNYEKASKIKYGTLIELKNKLQEFENIRLESKNKLIKEIVDDSDIALIVSKWTGIPINKLNESELDKLSKLEETLNEDVVGQNKAIHEVVSSIQIHRMGLSDQKKPIGSFLFLGPTGVGKTEIAKTIAKTLFGTEKDLIRIDMSEYMEKHSISKLIGPPPGYIGYEEGGQLTESLRHKPYSVILFDEFEKAHHDIWNILLQMLDDGHITDNQGRIINTKETIIILTSNIGAEIILEADEITHEIEKNIFNTLKKIIRPELINRLDSIIIFNRLNKNSIKKIAEKKLKELTKILENQNISLSYSNLIIEWLAENGYNKEFGARPLERLIKKEIMHKISQKIILEKKNNQKNIKIALQIINNEIIA